MRSRSAATTSRWPGASVEPGGCTASAAISIATCWSTRLGGDRYRAEFKAALTGPGGFLDGLLDYLKESYEVVGRLPDEDGMAVAVRLFARTTVHANAPPAPPSMPTHRRTAALAP